MRNKDYYMGIWVYSCIICVVCVFVCRSFVCVCICVCVCAYVNVYYCVICECVCVCACVLILSRINVGRPRSTFVSFIRSFNYPHADADSKTTCVHFYFHVMFRPQMLCFRIGLPLSLSFIVFSIVLPFFPSFFSPKVSRGPIRRGVRLRFYPDSRLCRSGNVWRDMGLMTSGIC